MSPVAAPAVEPHAAAMAYKLYYFPFRGRGEQIRLLFHALEVPFEDVRIRREEFAAMRDRGELAFGSLPMLEDGELRLPQGPAIMMYLGTRHGAVPGDPQHEALARAITMGAEDMRSKYFGLFGDGAEDKQAEFLGGAWKERWLPAWSSLLSRSDGASFFDTLTHADIAVWDALDAMTTFIPGANFDGHPEVQRFYDEIRTLGVLANYLRERPPK
jgi:glutathione S-transferase